MACRRKPTSHYLKMAGPTRLELATSGVTGRRSNQLNYDPAILFNAQIKPARGLEKRIHPMAAAVYRPRSCQANRDLRPKRAIIAYSFPCFSAARERSGRLPRKPGPARRLGERNGRNRARTCDPRLVRPVLSQLSYSPVIKSANFRAAAMPARQQGCGSIVTDNFSVKKIHLSAELIIAPVRNY